jgi:hypothetical protein
MSQPYQRFRREALESLLEAATRGHYDQAAQWLNALADFEARVDFSAAAVGCWEERATAFRTGIGEFRRSSQRWAFRVKQVDAAWLLRV